MIKCIATIQEGHEAERLRDELAKELKGIAAASFEDPPDNPEIKWQVIPKGFAWTGGRPSHSSVLLCVVPENESFKTRAKFMRRVNDMWIDRTGADASELLIVTHGTPL